MADEWVPFNLTADEAERYRVLVDGVPRPLREPIFAWLRGALAAGAYDFVVVDRTHQIEMMTGLRVGLGVEEYVKWSNYASKLRNLADSDLLRLVDAVLASGWSGVRMDALDKTLRLGRSKWMVGPRMGKTGLVAREPEGVQNMVEATIQTGGSAGQILARAWGKVHAFEPDDSGAYADAVRAVEAVAQPLVEPLNKEATLGGIASAMRDQGDWRLPLREHKHAPTGETIVAMLRTLYRGHVDRHGSDDYRDVTHEEALAGVALAATLVSWFSAGVVQRRSEANGSG